MGHLVPIQTQVQTSQGEVLLKIELNINLKLDTDGSILVEGKAKTVEELPVQSPSFKFQKPDIFDNTEIIEFGKQI